MLKVGGFELGVQKPDLIHCLLPFAFCFISNNRSAETFGEHGSAECSPSKPTTSNNP